MKYLLDTCVLSEYVKRKPNAQVISWIDDQDERSLFISILSIAELKKGIFKIKNSNPNRHKKLLHWLQQIEQRFSERILPLNKNILNIWAVICGQAEAKGNKPPIIDSLLVATAYEHDLIIVTRNTSDFKFSPIRLFNPWN